MSDYNAQKRPYWIEDVIGGGKYTPKVEEHGQVMENKLVAYEIWRLNGGLVVAVLGQNSPTLVL